MKVLRKQLKQPVIIRPVPTLEGVHEH
jgi:hypothetical protein